jgi:hypothetical protein
VETGHEAAKAVKERASSVLTFSAKSGRDISALLADLYAILSREERERGA